MAVVGFSTLVSTSEPWAQTLKQPLEKVVGPTCVS